MESTMQSSTQSAPVPKARIWTGRVISALITLFLIFDGVTKVIKVPQVIAASAKIGFSAGDVVAIGAVLLICTALYVIPKTSTLGAILLTGYLGGATATNVLAHTAAFNTSFPVIFGILVWLGLYLRHDGLRALVPFQS
jgi:DoxX-like family